MSFLTPLYIAGLLAVSLPILFHLIRRTPTGRVPFSTLMFLEPSPPRITRRRHLDNWLLLLLRAAALCLLAFAFARPFLREAFQTSSDSLAGRQVALLLDTSASMSRGRLWNDAVALVQKSLAETTEAESVALFTFDSVLSPVVGFDEWASLPTDARRGVVDDRLAKLAPRREATNLGEALAATAELLDAISISSPAAHSSRADRTSPSRRYRSREIILVSDLQAGSRLTALDGVEWPSDISVAVERVATDATTNAGIHFLAAESSLDDIDRRPRVRVTSAADSTREEFRLRWLHDGSGAAVAGAPDSESHVVSLYVPPGQSRVVRAPAISPSAEPDAPLRLLLEGDDHDFDNAAWFQPPGVDRFWVIYFCDEDADDSQQPRYYVERAFPDTPARKVELRSSPAASSSRAAAVELAALQQDDPQPSIPAVESGREAEGPHLVIVTGSVNAARTDGIRRFCRDGGTTIVMLRDAECIATLHEILERADIAAAEADVDGYAMLTDVDLEHPLLAPFSDVRFADFTKIRVWKHRSVDLTPVDGCRILARFDSGDPAIAEIPLGRGRILLFTTGWHPADSQLALSTKFVPLLNAVLDRSSVRSDRIHAVNAPMNRGATNDGVAGVEVESSRRSPQPPTVSRDAQSSERSARWSSSFSLSGQPEGWTPTDPDESRTEPLPFESLEAFGIPLAGRNAQVSPEVEQEKQRQMQNLELENRQRLWQWLVVAALVLLLAETWIAGRQGSRT